MTGGADAVESIIYSGGKLYERTGYVRDAATGAVVGQFTMPLEPDMANAQIIAMVPDPAHAVLLRPDDAEAAMITTHLILWGADGVAFNRNA